MIVLFYLVTFHFAVKTSKENENDEDLRFKESCEPRVSELLKLFNYDLIKDVGYLREEQVTHKVLKLSEEEKRKYGMTNDVFQNTESILLQKNITGKNKYLDENGFSACFNETNINGKQQFIMSLTRSVRISM